MIRDEQCKGCGHKFAFYLVVPYCNKCMKEMTREMRGGDRTAEYVFERQPYEPSTVVMENWSEKYGRGF